MRYRRTSVLNKDDNVHRYEVRGGKYRERERYIYIYREKGREIREKTEI